MEKNFNMGNGEEGGVFKMNDALFDDVPKEVKIDRDQENRKNAEEMRRRNEEYTARIKGQNKIEEKVEEKVLEDTKELNRHEIMRQKIAELNAKNEAWSQKVKEETDKNKKVEDEKVLDRNEVNQRNAEAMRLQNEAWVARGMKFDEKKLGELPAGGFRADKKELSDKAKSMRAYEEKKARQEEEMLRDKTKYLEKYDTRMKGKTAAGKFISKMAGWLGFWDKNRVGRGEELKQKEGEFYNSLENYVSLSDRVSKIQSDILSGKRKNAKGETKEYSQEVLERYRAKMARLELVRLGKEQKDVAGKRAETWNQIEENEIIEDAKRTWWSHPFRKAIGNRYVRFALMTGTIGALTGGVTSGAWLLGRGAKFGAGILAGKIGQKGAQFAVDKLLNEEKFIRNRYNKIATDYANGNINAHEYDKQVEKISLQLNAIKNLLPTLVAGASAAGAGYGLSKLDASTHVFDKISDKVSDTVRSAIPGNYPGLSGVPGQVDVPENITPPSPSIIESPGEENAPIDWIKGENIGETGPEGSIESPFNEDSLKMTVPNGAGAIESIREHQEYLKDLYEGKGVPIPEELSDYVNGDAEKIAINNDFYRPGETNESISVLRGSTIEFDTETGKPIFHQPGETPQHFFDSGSKISPESVLVDTSTELSTEQGGDLQEEGLDLDDTNTEPRDINSPDLSKSLDTRTDLPLDYKFLPGENFSAPIDSAHFNGMVNFTVGADGVPQIDFEKLGTKLPENFGGNYLTDNPKNLIDSVSSSSLNPTDTENFLQKQYNISDEGRLVGNSRLMSYEMYRMLYEELQPAPGTPEYTYLYQRLTDLSEKISKDLGINALKSINWQ